MSAATRARQPPSPPFIDPPGYGRHRPERTLLYQLVEQHYPAFRELRAAADRPLPDFVQQEFDAYLKCGRLEEGFLRVRCEHRALCALWRAAQDHRQHRGSADHSEDPVAPRARSGRAVPERAAAWGAGAPGAVQPAVNWRMSSDSGAG
jgi:hypothetical protein